LDLRTLYNDTFESIKPSKGTCINRNATYGPLSVQIGPNLRPVCWPRKWKKRKRREKKVTKPVYFSPLCGGVISQPNFAKFGEFVVLTDVITPAKIGSIIFIGFPKPKGQKSHFPLRNQTAYIKVPCFVQRAEGYLDAPDYETNSKSTVQLQTASVCFFKCNMK